MDLQQLNKEGLIPGPSETEEAFFARVVKAKKCLPVALNDFDAAPTWLDVFYDNKKLPFWQAAATWIEDDTPRIQLKKKNLLGYSTEEILSHEAVHAVRFAFDEPRFEEILAYHTSKNKFRRFFGPIFQHSWESTLFVVLVLASLIPYLKLLPWVFLTYLLVRLIRNQKTFSECKKNLSLSIMLRLTDKEIALFSKWENILPYINQAKDKSLRWRMIYVNYFEETQNAKQKTQN